MNMQQQYLGSSCESTYEAYAWIDGVRNSVFKIHCNRKMMGVQAHSLPTALARRMSKQLVVSFEGKTLREVRGRLGQARDPYLKSLVRCLDAMMALDNMASDQVLNRDEAFAYSWKLLRLLTKDLTSPSTMGEIDSIRRGHQRSCKALVKRLTLLRQHYAKLMIVRVDLTYGEVYVQDMAPEDRIEQDWEELKAFLNTKFASSFLGYAAKMEFRPKKGVHLHVLLAFNGRVVRQDVTIARLVGEHWKYVITQGAGGYFNCNTPKYKNRFAHCGVGVFSGLDEACVAGFQAVAHYVTKHDFLVGLIMAGRRKFFSCVFRDVTLKEANMRPLE